MDKIQKALNKLTPPEREKVKLILQKLNKNDFTGLDIKKLKNRNDIFRIRKGDIRIIYRVDPANSIFILTIERRSDTTYKF